MFRSSHYPRSFVNKRRIASCAALIGNMIVPSSPGKAHASGAQIEEMTCSQPCLGRKDCADGRSLRASLFASQLIVSSFADEFSPAVR